MKIVFMGTPDFASASLEKIIAAGHEILAVYTQPDRPSGRGKKLNYSFTSGTEFPDEFSPYKLVVHCGGCMLNEREMKYRLQCAEDQNMPITNYGVLIAYMQGILKRCIAPFPGFESLLSK